MACVKYQFHFLSFKHLLLLLFDNPDIAPFLSFARCKMG